MLSQRVLYPQQQPAYSSQFSTKNLDSINEAFFYKRPISTLQKEKAARGIIIKQYQSGKFSGMFPLKNDTTNTMHLFTGEKIKTLMAARNILMQEYARSLLLFDLSSVDVQYALCLATARMLQSCYSYQFCVMGECAHSAVGFMRYLAAGGVDDWERRLEAYIKILSENRTETGRWKGFPFYYTLLALTETNLPSGEKELKYALPACERALNDSIIQISIPNGDKI